MNEPKRYAIEVKDFDYGLLNARNQLIAKLINPALDTLLAEPVFDHIEGSKTRYSLTLYLKAEIPDLEEQMPINGALQ
jgi:hypothetical protein